MESTSMVYVKFRSNLLKELPPSEVTLDPLSLFKYANSEIFQVDNMLKKIGLFWLVLQGLLYILGAVIYAVRISRFTVHLSLKYSSGSNSREIKAWLF